MAVRLNHTIVSAARAGLVAAILSGAPSTLHALATKTDVLAATRAAGTLLGKSSTTRGALAHIAISAGWTAVLTAVHHRRPLTAGTGALAGLAIAALDLEVVGRRYPAIRALPRWPQWADHVAFGALVGGLLAWERPAGGTPVG